MHCIANLTDILFFALARGTGWRGGGGEGGRGGGGGEKTLLHSLARNRTEP